jgi:thioredoxin 2
MPDKSAYVRCNTCGVINRLPVDKLAGNPQCGKCRNHLEIPAKPFDVTTANFDREALAWPGNVLVEFWTPWCGYCRMMAPLVEKLAREKAGILRVVKVNLDNEPVLGARFSINATPTFYLYRHGVKLGDIAGAVPKEQFEVWVDAVLLA